jgi:hypothetical protein
LLGNRNPVTRPATGYRPTSVASVLASPLEQSLLWLSAGLVILTLIMTLLR